MGNIKKIILNVIYGFAGFNLLHAGFELLMVIMGAGMHKRWDIEIPLIMFILMLIISFTVLVLTIISFFKENWKLKIAALISQGALIFVILILFLVDFLKYIGLWEIAFFAALIFLIDIFIRKVWKNRQIESDSNAKNTDNSKEIVLGTIYGFSAFYLLVAGFEELVTFIMYSMRGGLGNVNGFFIGTIIMFIAFFAMLALTIISFFSKNRGVKIAALISQGALFLIALILSFVEDRLLVWSWYTTFRALLMFLMSLFVYKIWKNTQGELKLDELCETQSGI